VKVCGRYTLARLADRTELFPWITDTPNDVHPSYNVAPTYTMPIGGQTPPEIPS
jgi:putative SOS response-associated peptidase YedK